MIALPFCGSENGVIHLIHSSSCLVPAHTITVLFILDGVLKSVINQTDLVYYVK